MDCQKAFFNQCSSHNLYYSYLSVPRVPPTARVVSAEGPCIYVITRGVISQPRSKYGKQREKERVEVDKKWYDAKKKKIEMPRWKYDENIYPHPFKSVKLVSTKSAGNPMLVGSNVPSSAITVRMHEQNFGRIVLSLPNQ